MLGYCDAFIGKLLYGNLIIEKGKVYARKTSAKGNRIFHNEISSIQEIFGCFPPIAM